MKSRVLPIIAGCFGLVSVIQITNLSLANAGDKDKTIAAASQDHETDKSTDTLAHNEDQTLCLTPTMADAILSEQTRLEEKQISLSERELILKALEEKLDNQVAELEATKNSVQAQLDKIDLIANNDIKHLIEMYQTMKPKKAAEIFDNMDPKFAAGFLADMDSARAGLIMSEMDAQQSYEVSLVIATRNAHLRKKKQPA